LVEKHDHFAIPELRNLGYGTQFFDVDSAMGMAEQDGEFKRRSKVALKKIRQME
jgi:hypothetical protein